MKELSAGTKPDEADDAGKTDGGLVYVWDMAEGHDSDVCGRYIRTWGQYKV